ncbi:hypothetical protein [Amnibacterium kyonggiense]|uniref:Uncharacterized protein n=1 Tax=Amnibacterium kyonggiense TaxID=595671 RepID=A0A4R7FSQ0_9MICO|nr:hypothetical protein [Amnibacterium kyonggiense]TDS80699.1 hypothetical protein CLV52_1266 [Amnibacterium kyonggiense]
MGAPKLRPLLALAAVVLGVALAPAAVAAAEPIRAAALQQTDVASLTQAEARLDAASQRTTDGGSRAIGDGAPTPPAWLLLLLVPILAGGGIAVGSTVRRLQ